MADAEAKLAAEIARLEMELQKARHVSKQQHCLQQELSAVKNVLDEEEFMIIQDLIDDTGEDEYEEVTEHSYEESYDEVEEYSEEEEYSEYEEVTDCEDEEDKDEATTVDLPPQMVSQPATLRPIIQVKEAPMTPTVATQRQSAMDSLKTAVQSGQQNLRRTPWRRKQEESTVKRAETAAHAVPKKEVPVDAQRVKKKVRPPPSKGGKPVARIDPKEVPKQTKKNPLSRLIKRNAEKQEQSAERNEPKPEAAPEAPKEETAAERKKKIIKRLVKKNTAGKPVESKKTKPASGNAPFKRRQIPNLQPSAAGEETIFEKLLGQKLITNPKLHKSSTKGCVKDQELICFYFGAVWKSDCKRFNTLLKDFYYTVAQQTNLEVVYVSADRSLIEFKDCYVTMPFLAMPAGTTSLKNELTKALKIIEMPTLAVLDDEGNVVTVEGVQKIQELEKGNAKQALQLVDRWKKTRPIPIADVQLDKTLLHGTMERGTIYWQG